jgi:hypothetical protein
MPDLPENNTEPEIENEEVFEKEPFELVLDLVKEKYKGKTFEIGQNNFTVIGAENIRGFTYVVLSLNGSDNIKKIILKDFVKLIFDIESK